MHQRVYQEFERICAERKISGSVLEVGAIPDEGSLLCMKSLAGATEKIGIDFLGPHEFRDFNIVQGNANSMDCFPNGRFDAVICNATFEHDKYFWKSIAEIKRVTKPGGLIVIGVPGFAHVKGERLKGALGKMPLINRLRFHPYFNLLFTGTVTYQVHNFPGDYYRFSDQAMKEVILEGLEQIDVRQIMLPPRFIGSGVKPRQSPS
jgi:ubiquinone/menaquinone biosynthesis C-methylase UbiE